MLQNSFSLSFCTLHHPPQASSSVFRGYGRWQTSAQCSRWTSGRLLETFMYGRRQSSSQVIRNNEIIFLETMTVGVLLVLLLRRISPRPMTTMTRVRTSKPKQQRDPFPVFLCRARYLKLTSSESATSIHRVQDATKMPHAVLLLQLLSEYSHLGQSQVGLPAFIRFLFGDHTSIFPFTISLSGR